MIPKKISHLANRTIAAGRTFLVLTRTCPGYWARGSTLEKAIESLRKIGCVRVASTPLLVVDAPEDAYVDDLAVIHWSDGTSKIETVYKDEIKKEKEIFLRSS